MATEENFQVIERDYSRSRKRPWFALIIGAQIGLMLAFLLYSGGIGF